jgi:predicted short-subunit dehydrogenase-like oxidoreductase (DUF2520 family)
MELDNRSWRIGFIGAGTLGSGLALALNRMRYDVRAVSSRTRQSAEALAGSIPGCQVLESSQDVADATDLVFITTPDSAITPVATSIRWRAGQRVVHCCGASGRDLLQPAADQGAETGAFHPFQTFAGIDSPDRAVARLTGVTFAISAEGGLAEFLATLTKDLGGLAVAVGDNQRALYHAAATLGCGYLVTLLQAALEALQDSGFSREEALQALVCLSRATLENVALQGPAASATGPLVRGDAATVRRHLEELRRRNPPVAVLYGALTEISLPLALSRGLGPEGESAIRQAVADIGFHHQMGKR